ncbi:MAG: hypothetical protein IPL65_04875 [Lewinellaceae bacterium]|nr:hypothetical protein [Lewinellaceae bacterium]
MMTRIQHLFSQISDRQLMWLAVGLALPAFLLNLSQMSFIGDEAIRSLVALEMDLSGDYIKPTLNGVAYFKNHRCTIG